MTQYIILAVFTLLMHLLWGIWWIGHVRIDRFYAARHRHIQHRYMVAVERIKREHREALVEIDRNFDAKMRKIYGLAAAPAEKTEPN